MRLISGCLRNECWARRGRNLVWRDSAVLIKALTEGGIPESDAREFTDILSKEQPTSKEEPLGEGGTRWFVTHIKKAAEGVWKTGVSEATKLVTKMAARYYGLE